MERSSRTVKIALIIPPSLELGQTWCANLPIGLAYLAAVLEKAGCELTVLDCPALEIDHKKLGAKIASFEPNVVGITSVTPTIKSALLAAYAAKENCPNAVVVLGGPHPTFMDGQILSECPDVDIVVRGEGEQTILELVRHIVDSGDLQAVSGISFRKNKQIIRMPSRPFIRNLDQLPRPAYQYFSLNKYRFFGKVILPILTSRGCPFQCSYCVSSRMVGKMFRARSPKSVVDELEWLRDVHGAGAFSFYDDAFTYDKKRAIEICEEIKKRNIGVPWDCQSRVDQISRELLAEMRDANCQLVSFGVESGNQKILDAMKKRTTIEQNEKAVRFAKEVGISVAISVIIGYPGETIDTLNQTFDFIRRTEPDYVYLCLATPYPGTDLRSLLEGLGWKMSAEWSHYDMETPVFENPSLPVDLRETRRGFYNRFYSWSYILRQSLKGTFYSQNMARTALNDRMWRMKLPKWVSANLKKLRVQQKSQRDT
ncbi:MAG: radical SAM protein [Candidatus Bathyarchaeota archaeon]|nr:radical SAM protein [Candidatus Bathyarchaeota archaeon]